MWILELHEASLCDELKKSTPGNWIPLQLYFLMILSDSGELLNRRLSPDDYFLGSFSRHSVRRRSYRGDRWHASYFAWAAKQDGRQDVSLHAKFFFKSTPIPFLKRFHLLSLSESYHEIDIFLELTWREKKTKNFSPELLWKICFCQFSADAAKS